jgi:hypothetical protein
VESKHLVIGLFWKFPAKTAVERTAKPSALHGFWAGALATTALEDERDPAKPLNASKGCEQAPLVICKNIVRIQPAAT